MYPGGDVEISGSVKAYFALKLTGHDPSAEYMLRARSAILMHGGADAVNSFTRFYLALLGQMHGRSIRTVEGLRGPDGGAHPVQRALAEADATQCGFCTPGIVMTAWAHAREGGDVHDALAGNLCRCTGYRPIVEALGALQDDGAAPPAPPTTPATRLEAPGQVFHRPASLDDLLTLRAAGGAAAAAWIAADPGDGDRGGKPWHGIAHR